MCVILATWEAELWRIEVPGQPRPKSSGDHISMEKAGCDGMYLSSQLQQEA
jgi:hypothetical protein